MAHLYLEDLPIKIVMFPNYVGLITGDWETRKRIDKWFTNDHFRIGDFVQQGRQMGNISGLDFKLHLFGGGLIIDITNK